ncbi:hypothetical protein CCACVL1_19566 [Corchorus capsularis]|uniref:Uncharacterized protein n=1 Tax=Corchorus capsularis TaxID=210143 RepID=A0A1R3HG12_COCAP|nr:hypothetical protein CCACVL1_19566 [Corchorus capsularis]
MGRGRKGGTQEDLLPLIDDRETEYGRYGLTLT